MGDVQSYSLTSPDIKHTVRQNHFFRSQGAAPNCVAEEVAGPHGYFCDLEGIKPYQDMSPGASRFSARPPDRPFLSFPGSGRY